MRIGNIDDIHKSQDADNLASLIRTDNRKNMTKLQKCKNWWHYHQWYIICGIIILLIACNIISSKLGIFDKSPDFQIAYVGSAELPSDTVSALEQAFASIAGDFNGDGEVIVKVNQYVNDSTSSVPGMVSYAYASEIALIGDIESCDSYFFLMEDPAYIQKAYQVLATPDGGCPDEKDDSVADKVILWTDSIPLSDMELGSYTVDVLGQTISGDSQKLLSTLYLGRRCFYTDVLTDNAEECSNLWDMLFQSRRKTDSNEQ